MTLDKINEMLFGIAELKREIAAIENIANEDIASIRKETENETAPLRVRMDALESRVREYAETHKQILFSDGSRSRNLSGGSFGFRSSVKLGLKKGKTWDKIISLLKEKKPELLRIKEEINKPAAMTLPDAELGSLGMARETADSFWYKTA